MDALTRNNGPHGGTPPSTANDRLKRSWNRWLGSSIAFAAVLHAAVLVLWPRIDVEVPDSYATNPARVVTLTPPPLAAELPRPPADVFIPALPTVEDFELDLALRDVPAPDFDDPSLVGPIEVPTLASQENAWLDFENFAPFVVRPELRNRAEMRRFLERHYQPILEFSGVTGIVQLAFWIDETGEVARVEITESSGSRMLDRLAMRLSKILRFSPAIFAGRPVRVQVRLPIAFRAV